VNVKMYERTQAGGSNLGRRTANGELRNAGRLR
jgi:hypothetical protein